MNQVELGQWPGMEPREECRRNKNRRSRCVVGRADGHEIAVCDETSGGRTDRLE